MSTLQELLSTLHKAKHEIRPGTPYLSEADWGRLAEMKEVLTEHFSQCKREGVDQGGRA